MPPAARASVHPDVWVLRLRKQENDLISTTEPSLRCERMRISSAALLKYALACQTRFPGCPVAAGSCREAWPPYYGTTGPPAGVRRPTPASAAQHSNLESQAVFIAGTSPPDL